MTLKPCLMMSPLSVSQFLESECYQFDTVIFDEASQVHTEDAVGAIMRGKQTIIVGDTKQLPPTNFFLTSLNDEDFDIDSAESIEKIGECTDYDFMDAVIKAMKLVRDEYDEYFKDTKRCLFAHSMGSMAAQRYIQKYPNDFDYVVLSGTDIGGGKYKFGKPLLKLFTKDGKIKYSNFVLNMSTTGFNKKFKKDHPKYGWLSRNPHNIKAFEESPYCGKDFPTNYFYSMAKMMCENVKPENLKRINPKVKIFIYSGKEDPVSNYGKSILKLEKLYKKYGLNVTSKVIPNARHEVHNENEEIKLELFKTIVDFYSK